VERRGLIVAALLVGLAGGAALGCRAMDKSEIGARLLALPKNAPVAALGLQRNPMTLTVDGQARQVELVRYGTGTPRIVFVHGTPGSLFTWSELVFGRDGGRGLAEDFGVLALDVVGHGVQPDALDPLTFQRAADYVGAALEALDLRDVCLVGHSYGGEFAWRAALDHPERVRELVLIDSAGYPRRDDEWLPEEVKMREWSIATWGWIFNSRERVRSALQPHFAEPVGDERLEEMFLCCNHRGNWRAMVQLARDENGTRAGELADLRARTLLVWGERDLAYGVERFARQFERDIPAARLEVVPGAGHYPHEERPDEVARLMREFLLQPADVEGGH
jgi:pimeloyl-ACP methyl ester carboxylesterase